MDTGSSGREDGTIGGLIVAAVLIFVITVVAAVCLIWYCRQRAKQNSVNTKSGAEVLYETPEDYTDCRAYGVHRSMVEANQSKSSPIATRVGSKEQPTFRDDEFAYETPRDSQEQFTTSAAYVSRSDTHAAQKTSEPTQPDNRLLPSNSYATVKDVQAHQYMEVQ